MTLNLSTANAEYTFTLYPVDTKFYGIAGIYLFLIIPNSCNSEASKAEALKAELSYSIHYSTQASPITFREDLISTIKSGRQYH